jgi:hypothetical protein
MRGRCSCGAVVYRLRDEVLCVNACHCTWCQRETGSAFAMNGIIETRLIEIERGAPEPVETPSASGAGQTILRCGHCRVALWSHYAGAGRRFAFVRMGTLDETRGVVPDVHIFTTSKQDWVILPDGAPVFEEYYRREEVWRPEALARREAELARGA